MRTGVVALGDVRRVGLISDTHGQVRPEALAALAGVEVLLHAGDVGRPDVLDRLRGVAPVYAVRGNVDHGDWAERLPRELDIAVGGVRLYMVHQPEHIELMGRTVDVAIHGHTHLPRHERREGVLYLNPGSAGPQRFDKPVTLALLEVAGPEVSVRIVELLTGGDWTG